MDNHDFHCGVKYARLEKLREYLSKGADPNQECCGAAMIVNAIDAFQPKVLELLIEYGADINNPNLEKPVLFKAAKDIDSLKVLVDAGADLTITHKGKTVLHAVCEHDPQCPSTIEYVIGRKVININETDENGRTPLVALILTRTQLLLRLKKTFRALLENGADVNIKDNFGHYALEYAFCFRPDIIPDLFEFGAILRPHLLAYKKDNLEHDLRVLECSFKQSFKFLNYGGLNFLAAREKNENSPLSKEYLPFDLFKELFKMFGEIVKNDTWDTTVKLIGKPPIIATYIKKSKLEQ